LNKHVGKGFVGLGNLWREPGSLGKLRTGLLEIPRLECCVSGMEGGVCLVQGIIDWRAWDGLSVWGSLRGRGGLRASRRWCKQA
jgi:hypothetical protein